MVLVAPQDGIVNILPNFRAQGSFGSAPPPFKEGDRAWTGAAIAEIPDLSNMRIELKLEEVDRGKLQTRTEGPCARRCHRRPRIERRSRLDQPDRLGELPRRAASVKRPSRLAPL